MSVLSAWRSLARRLARDLSREPPPGRRDEEAWGELDQRLRALLPKARLEEWLPAADVEDVLQAVLVKLTSAATLSRLGRAHSPDGFLLTMLRNQARDVVRKQARGDRLARELRVVPPASTEPAPGDEDPRLAVLRSAVAELPEDERELLLWRFADGLSITEIARRRGVPYSRLAVRLFRLQRRLRVKLEKEAPTLERPSEAL